MEFNYCRRPTVTVKVGNVAVGSDYPIRLQSMNSTSTTDVEGSVAQALRIAQAGADIDRLTAQGVREAEALGEIRSKLREAGCTMPLVADIHFNPRAAFAAATRVEKVRINPGNFVDPGRVFKKIEFTDEEYAAELRKIDDAFGPFVELCKANGTAIRIGVNHGSLSDRIMSRYGDTPAGMVESAMEFLRVARRHNFNGIIISIKASNTVIMVETVRRLVAAMDQEDMHYPLHLGVTEAGDGDDGRVRSAVGIGTLLSDGIGDTIRVSLSEEPECEVPVARELTDYITARASAPFVLGRLPQGFDPFAPKRRKSRALGKVGGTNVPVVLGYDKVEAPLLRFDASMDCDEMISAVKAAPEAAVVLTSTSQNPVGEIAAAICALTEAGVDSPVIASLGYGDLPHERVVIRAAADFGTLLLNGLLDGIEILAGQLDHEAMTSLALGILQAARVRVSKTEFVSCPGCGRTMFDLQTTVHQVKAATSHLKGLKIAVMGCIVNGPGEMADADYGYVGAAAGNVTLYRGKTAVEKNIPSAQALDHLIDIIKADGLWQEPEA